MIGDNILIGLRSSQILLGILLSSRLIFALIEFRVQKKAGRITHSPIDVRYATLSILISATAIAVFFAPEHIMRLMGVGTANLYKAMLFAANSLNIVSSITALVGLCSAAGQRNLRLAAAVYLIPVAGCLAVSLWIG